MMILTISASLALAATSAATVKSLNGTTLVVTFDRNNQGIKKGMVVKVQGRMARVSSADATSATLIVGRNTPFKDDDKVSVEYSPQGESLQGC
jgi:hypothetical protein